PTARPPTLHPPRPPTPHLHTLPLHDALPISELRIKNRSRRRPHRRTPRRNIAVFRRNFSESSQACALMSPRVGRVGSTEYVTSGRRWHRRIPRSFTDSARPTRRLLNHARRGCNLTTLVIP